MVFSTASLPITAKAIQLLFEDFRQERALNDTTILKTLTSLYGASASVIDTCTKTNRVTDVRRLAHRALVNTTIVIVCQLILYILLHFFVL